MPADIQVRLRDGRLAMCCVVDSGSVPVAKFEGREFEIERRLGAWRERSQASPYVTGEATREPPFDPSQRERD